MNVVTKTYIILAATLVGIIVVPEIVEELRWKHHQKKTMTKQINELIDETNAFLKTLS